MKMIDILRPDGTWVRLEEGPSKPVPPIHLRIVWWFQEGFAQAVELIRAVRSL